MKYAAKVTPPAEASPSYIPVPTAAAAPITSQYPSLAPVPPKQPAAPIEFVVIDQLGPGQTAERVNVTLGGRQFGEFSLSPQQAQYQISGTANSAGLYAYEITADTAFGNLTLHCAGSGSIYLVDGAKYYIQASYDATPCLAGLQLGN